MKLLVIFGVAMLVLVSAQSSQVEEEEIALLHELEAVLEQRQMEAQPDVNQQQQEEQLQEEDKQEAPLPTIGDVLKNTPVLPVIPKNPDTCCNQGVTYVDLRNGDVHNINNPAVQVLAKPEPQKVEGECSMRALLKVNFEKITTSPCGLTDGCLYGPYCGRRMLRVDLSLSSHPRSGWLFNIGDSVTNNGYKGDSNTQQNDAEIDGQHPNINIYSSDMCPQSSLAKLASHTDAIAHGLVSHVTLYISDKHVRITNDNGLDVTLCHKCFFALNGQADASSGGVNQDIYVGLNRVITGMSKRNGVGVCSAVFRWMCPW